MIDLYNEFWKHLSAVVTDEKKLNLLKGLTEKKLLNPVQGDFPRWHNAFNALPSVKSINLEKCSDAITCQSKDPQLNSELIKKSLQQLIPWRKGPFQIFDCFIDSEWQSHMKWNRIKNHIPSLKNKVVLDVGCGNGYYMFRMLEQTPHLLMGIDPGLLQIMQFWAVDKYIQSKAAILPLALESLPKKLLCFDVVFSMGVLYHRKSPIHHIIELAELLKKGGELVIETLIVDGDASTCLLPTSRYAQMRNVWFLPSIDMLSTMLKRNGFKNVKCVDVSVTTIKEQRSTDWMKFHSLEHFLNSDQSKTIEGYPLPKRATLVAQKV
ncbi:MAG: tRNA 5-methoxyuridine(34)/uridine 5-oxyacetic acid(34) synthase CmoB [Marinicellaceae bacterium]